MHHLWLVSCPFLLSRSMKFCPFIPQYPSISPKFQPLHCISLYPHWFKLPVHTNPGFVHLCDIDMFKYWLKLPTPSPKFQGSHLTTEFVYLLVLTTDRGYHPWFKMSGFTLTLGLSISAILLMLLIETTNPYFKISGFTLKPWVYCISLY